MPNILRTARQSALAAFVLLAGCSAPPPPPAPSSPQDGVSIQKGVDSEPVHKPADAEGKKPAEVAREPVAPSRAPEAPKPAPTKPYYYRRVVAVGIGIEKYLHVKDVAKHATNDATKVLELLRDNYGYETVSLIGPQATKSAIRATLAKYRKELGNRDALIVFFAGHGKVIDLPGHGTAGYLIPYDADLELNATVNHDEWSDHALNMRDLTAEFQDADAQHVLFVLDACCSGFMTRRGGVDFKERSDLQELMARRSRTVLAATTESGSAYPRLGTSHGNFSGNLLAQLSTSNASSVTEVFLAARAETVKTSKRLMIPQRGEFGTGDGEFVFIPKAIKQSEVDLALAAIRDKAAERTASRTVATHLYDLVDAVGYRAASKRAELDKLWTARLDRFRENAALGDPLALTGLSLCLARGLGTDVNTEQANRDAYQAAKKAFGSGTPTGKFALAMCLLHGSGAEKNALSARELLQQAYEGGFALAGLPLADMLLEGAPTPEQVQKADELLERAEKAGIPGATVRRAALILQKSPVLSAEETDRWVSRLKPAVDSGLPTACFQTYQLLRSDPKRLTDPQRALALKCLTRAAEAGSAEAQYRLAAEYYQNEWFASALKIPKDYVAAREWALAASAQKHYDATRMLAAIHVLGNGVKRDPDLAQVYYKKSREYGPWDVDFWNWFVSRASEAQQEIWKEKERKQ